ncbi:MAG: A24 family peptidase [Gammaproteobacteria bacterium]|nr:A24 family peptidase [Gammaproteobacteria bacterium]
MEPLQSLSPAVIYGLVMLLGLVAGSFLNVVIHRLPVMMERDWRRQCRDLEEEEAGTAHEEQDTFNLMVPRSRCPACGHPIGALENIPLLSYLLLRGRCRACGTPISLRYPLVELLGGVLAVAVVWQFGVTWAAAAAIVLSWSLLALTFIDLDTMLLPDQITLPLLWLGLLVNLNDTFAALGNAVVGAVAGYGLLWLVYHGFRLITGKEGMGYGDFKLLAMLGAWLGWQVLPLVILLSSVVGAVTGIALIVARRRQRSQPLPFGPFLAAAGWIALMWGEDIMDAYLGGAAPPLF